MNFGERSIDDFWFILHFFAYDLPETRMLKPFSVDRASPA